MVSHQSHVPGDTEAEIAALNASIASLKVKLAAAQEKTAGLKKREAEYIETLRTKWKSRADKISGYQQRQVDLDAAFDTLRGQYAKSNSECQQHLAVHQKVKQKIMRLALGQQAPADYAVGAAILPEGTNPGGPVIVPTASGPMLVVPGPGAHAGDVFQFLYPMHPPKATTAVVVQNSPAASQIAKVAVQQQLQPQPEQQQQQAVTQAQTQAQPQAQSRLEPQARAQAQQQAQAPAQQMQQQQQLQPQQQDGGVVQQVPPLPVAAVSDPGDFPTGWPKAQWRLNFTYADLLRSPWQKWLAHAVVDDEPPAPVQKKAKKLEGPSRYELLKLETSLKWQLKIEESSVTFYENLMGKYDAMMERAEVNTQHMNQHIDASEANYGVTRAYMESEIKALQSMCDAAQDLSSPGGQSAVTQMTSAPQSFGILGKQARQDQQTTLEQAALAFVVGAKHCTDEYDWRRVNVQHWQDCAAFCKSELGCQGFRFTLVSVEDNCQLTDSCSLGSNRATAFEKQHWQTFFKRSKPAEHGTKQPSVLSRVMF